MTAKGTAPCGLTWSSDGALNPALPFCKYPRGVRGGEAPPLPAVAEGRPSDP